MLLTAEDVCRLCELDVHSSVGIVWRYFVWRQIDGAPVAGVVSEICDQLKMPRPAVYSIMKRCLRPVLEADPEFWAAAGLRRQTTVTGLARELVRVWEEDAGRGDYQDAAAARSDGGAAAVENGD